MLIRKVGQGVKRKKPELHLCTVQSLSTQTQLKSIPPAGCNTICTVFCSVVLADLWVGAMGCWLPVQQDHPASLNDRQLGNKVLLKYSRRLFPNVCNLIVLVSSFSHEYFIWLPQVIAGEENLGDPLAQLRIAGKKRAEASLLSPLCGEARNSLLIAWGTGSRQNVFCQYEAA